MRNIFPLVALLLFAGCQSSPRPEPLTAAAEIIPTVTDAPTTTAPVVSPDLLPERTAAAIEARDRLLKGGQQHQVLMQSAFRQTPGFTVANWSGLVLSPKDLRQGIVVSSRYKVERVEIHPLTDGRLRVWVEIANTGRARIQPEGACEFRPTSDERTVKFKRLPPIDAKARIVVFFESERPQMEGYSILVRDSR